MEEYDAVSYLVWHYVILSPHKNNGDTVKLSRSKYLVRFCEITYNANEFSSTGLYATIVSQFARPTGYRIHVMF